MKQSNGCLILFLLGFVSSLSACQLPPPGEYYNDNPFVQEIPFIVRIEDAHSIFRGTGFVVSQSGLVFTVSHVVRYNDPVRAVVNGKVYLAETVYDDPVLDITLVRLRLNGESLSVKIPCFWISDSIQSGDTVVILGERREGGAAIVVAHMISWSTFHIWPGSYREVMRFYPADSKNRPRPGFSGAPIFNVMKHIIGVFCCSEDEFYNGIPSQKIISALSKSGLLDEICVVSESRPFPLPGWTFDLDKV